MVRHEPADGRSERRKSPGDRDAGSGAVAKAAAERRPPGGYAGQLLRVDLTRPAGPGPSPGRPTTCATYLGGIGLGAKILYDEVPAEVALGPSRQPPHPGHRPAGGPAGLGDGRAHRRHARRADRRRHVDPGQRLLRRQPQVLGLRRDRDPGAGHGAVLPLHQRRLVEMRDAATWPARTPGRRRRRSSGEHGLSGHRCPCTPSAPPARTWCASPPSTATTATSPPRTACGAVMGKKKLKAVCIVRGTQGAPGARRARAHPGRRRHRPRPQDGSRRPRRSTTTARCRAS